MVVTSRPEYWIYHEARKRCENPANAAYDLYGGRGIQFRFDSFEEFLSVVGERPSSDLTLDRIDNNGHYEKGNVRWVSRKVQSNNRRKRSHSKLTPFAARVMRKVYELGTFSQRDLAQIWNVSVGDVNGILNNRIWV